jgi:hypothetical protein
VKRRGPGRPKLPKAKRKVVIFSIRLSEKERAQIDRAARARELKAADWARSILVHEAFRACMAPVGNLQSVKPGKERLCGKPATATRVIEGIDWPLCQKHADEIDADYADPARRP